MCGSQLEHVQICGVFQDKRDEPEVQVLSPTAKFIYKDPCLNARC